MPFNVNNRSIARYLHEISHRRFGDERSESLYYHYLCVALERPLAKELSNQQTPDNLIPIRSYDPEYHPAWVKASLSAGTAVYDFEPGTPLAPDIDHVADWLAAAHLNDAPWLSDTDEKHRPRKLLKIGSVQQAVREADKAMMRANSAVAKTEPLTDKDIVPVKQFPCGSKIVQLLSVRALDAESRAMNHCIGHGAYDRRLTTDVCSYFSLRSQSGKTCATMEVRNHDNTLLQCKGRQNTTPISKYMPAIQAFVQERRLKLAERPRMTGLLEQDGIYYDLRNLPDKLHWKSDLELQGTTIPRLPDHLIVDGNLCLSGTKLKALPKRLKVGKNLSINHSEIERLPPGLIVPGCLIMHHTCVPELPAGLKVGKNLRADNCGALKTIAPDIKIGGYLDLSHTLIERLPDNLKLAGPLMLTNTPIRQLPNGLSCQGLNIDLTSIEALPPDINLNNARLSACGLKLKSLPESLKVDVLFANSTTFETLPQKMEVAQHFVIDRRTRLPSIPPYLSGKFHCTGDLWKNLMQTERRQHHQRTRARDQEQDRA